MPAVRQEDWTTEAPEEEGQQKTCPACLPEVAASIAVVDENIELLLNQSLLLLCWYKLLQNNTLQLNILPNVLWYPKSQHRSDDVLGDRDFYYLFNPKSNVENQGGNNRTSFWVSLCSRNTLVSGCLCAQVLLCSNGFVSPGSSQEVLQRLVFGVRHCCGVMLSPLILCTSCWSSLSQAGKFLGQIVSRLCLPCMLISRQLTGDLMSRNESEQKKE